MSICNLFLHLGFSSLTIFAGIILQRSTTQQGCGKCLTFSQNELEDNDCVDASKVNFFCIVLTLKLLHWRLVSMAHTIFLTYLFQGAPILAGDTSENLNV